MNKLFDDSDELEQNPPVKRPRGRPRRIKIFEAQGENPLKKKVIGRPNVTVLEKKPRGRPKKEKPPIIEKKGPKEGCIRNLIKGKINKPTLTIQQKKFCELLVLEKKCITDAALLAGYSVKNASTVGSQLRRKPIVALYIQQLEENERNKVMDERERWLKELKRLAYSDIGEVVTNKGTIKAIHEIHEDTRAAIKNITVDEKLIQGFKVGETIRVSMYDKINALKLYGAANCWYQDRIRHDHRGLEEILQEATELYEKDKIMLAERAKAAAELSTQNPLFDDAELDGDSDE